MILSFFRSVLVNKDRERGMEVVNPPSLEVLKARLDRALDGMV